MSVRNAVENAENLPNGARVYLFGSACYRQHPRDIDLLFVYDDRILPPEEAYGSFRPMSEYVGDQVGIHVHPTVLSVSEFEASNFLEKVEPVELRMA